MRALVLAHKHVRQFGLSSWIFQGSELTLLDGVDQREWALKEAHGAENEMRARMDCSNECRRTRT
jgi:hypothetical protein